jgi:hypothetical protein
MLPLLPRLMVLPRTLATTIATAVNVLAYSFLFRCLWSRPVSALLWTGTVSRTSAGMGARALVRVKNKISLRPSLLSSSLNLPHRTSSLEFLKFVRPYSSAVDDQELIVPSSDQIDKPVSPGAERLPPGFKWDRNSKLVESDLDERYAKGGGPGGQSVNKTSNKVILTHIPTGISVQCHQERELTTNRSLARKWLKEKLDYLANGKNSKKGKKIEKIRKRKQNAARRAKKKYGSATGADNKSTINEADDVIDSENCDDSGSESDDSESEAPTADEKTL